MCGGRYAQWLGDFKKKKREKIWKHEDRLEQRVEISTSNYKENKCKVLNGGKINHIYRMGDTWVHMKGIWMSISTENYIWALG